MRRTERAGVPPIVTELDPTTAIDINPQPSATPSSRAAEFRYPVASLADNWNPFNPLGNDFDFTNIREPMSSNVWNADADGTFTLNQNFVLESSTSEGTTGEPFDVTYKLNPDAKWNNGDPIDVDDYIATWQSPKREGPPGLRGRHHAGLRDITSIEPGADEFEVVITFDDVYPTTSRSSAVLVFCRPSPCNPTPTSTAGPT